MLYKFNTFLNNECYKLNKSSCLYCVYILYLYVSDMGYSYILQKLK